MGRFIPRAWAGILVAAGALLLAAFSVCDHVGSYNDQSRLATVESLVDYRTFAIEQSVFAETGDKVYIDGRFYSHKSPVPALLMAGFYKVWQGITGRTAREHPPSFCWWMTLTFSGLAYVAAVCCIYALGARLGLSPPGRLALTASFALATTALTYLRYVNDHIFLLGVAAGVMLGLARLAEITRAGGQPSWGLLLALGTGAGLGATIDLGAGPVLLVVVLALVAYRCRRLVAAVVFMAAALPWVVLHLAINYSLGGTLRPVAAVPEYFDWPGSDFHSGNLTGGWHHHGKLDFALYAVRLLVSDRGFLLYNLPLLPVLPALVALLRRRGPHRPEVLGAASCCLGVWLVYAAGSNNYSGGCCSIRWFVPLLAPAYFILAVYLGQGPRKWCGFLALSAWGTVVGVFLCLNGPWVLEPKPVLWPVDLPALGIWLPPFWPLAAAALVNWACCAVWEHVRVRKVAPAVSQSFP